MTDDLVQFEFPRSVPLTEVQRSLFLSILAVEGLFGPSRTLLEIGYVIDKARRTIQLGYSEPVGRALVRVFTRLLSCEFGNQFQVRRVPSPGRRLAKGNHAKRVRP